MKIPNDAPIGIIDSGVGGLTVVKEIIHYLPAETIIYIGDDARCPYGPRSVEEVKEFTMEMASALAKMGIKMLVVACNTATAVTLDLLRERFPFPVIGVIEPGARAATLVSSTGRIAVLGTVGTIKSKAYENAISAISAEADIIPLACPEFVPLVESGQYKQMDIRAIMKRSLEPIAHIEFDTAILGCTHYPLLHDQITRTTADWREYCIISIRDGTGCGEHFIRLRHCKHLRDTERASFLHDWTIGRVPIDCSRLARY